MIKIKRLFIFIFIFILFKCINKQDDFSLADVKQLILNKQYKAAIEKLNVIDTPYYEISELKGVCYFNENNYNQALKYFNIALKNNEHKESLYLYTTKYKENLEI